MDKSKIKKVVLAYSGGLEHFHNNSVAQGELQQLQRSSRFPAMSVRARSLTGLRKRQRKPEHQSST